MAKEVKTTVTNQTIHGAPAPNLVRVYGKDGSEQDMYPVDAKEAVAGGEYSFEAIPAGENVYKPAKPGAPLTAEAETEESGVRLTGPLADDFPGKSALEAGGFSTYAKTRKLVAKGDNWWADVAGIGEATAAQIEAALKE